MNGYSLSSRAALFLPAMLFVTGQLREQPHLRQPTPFVENRSAATTDSTFAYVANFSSNAVSVIATATNTVVATIPVGSGPDGIAITQDSAFAYVANSGSNTVSVIDTRTKQVVGTPISVGTAPRGITICNSDHCNANFAYVANSGSNSVSVIDVRTRKVVGSPIPVGIAPIGIAIDPSASTVYVANSGSSTVSVINTGTNAVDTTLKVGSNPFGVAIDRVDGPFVYVTSFNSDTVSVIRTNGNTSYAAIAVPGGTNVGQLQGVVTSSGSDRVYVANSANDEVKVLDGFGDTLITTIGVIDVPYGLAITSNGALVYVTNANGKVSVINTATNTTLPDITVGGTLTGVAIVTVPAAVQYHLTLSGTGNGNGTITGTAGVTGTPSCTWDGSKTSGTCDVIYNANASVTLTATAGTGSSFAGWTGACTNVTGPCQVTMSQSQSVTAKYALFQYHLVLTGSGTGSGTITGTAGVNGTPSCVWSGSTPTGTCDVVYNANTPVTLTATAGTGSSFAGWTGDCSNVTGPCQVTMSQAHSVTARFTLLQYHLTLAGSGTGSGTITGTTGVNGTPSCMWDGNAPSGTCDVIYNANTPVTLTAAAGTGSSFAGWTGDCTNVTGPCQVTMIQVHSVTAKFTLLQYHLALTGSGTGSGTITGTAGVNGTPSCMWNGSTPTGMCDVTYNANTPVTLTATAGTGSSFAGWTGACTNTSGPCQVTMSQAQSVTAKFTLTQYHLVLAGSGTGSGTITGTAGVNGTPSCAWDGSTPSGACDVLYNYNTPVTLTATAGTGSSFAGWTGACTNTSGPCQVTMSQAQSVTARFSPQQTPVLTLAGTGNGSGTITGTAGNNGTPNCLWDGSAPSGTCSVIYNANTPVTLTAAAGTGSSFAGWIGACSNTSGPCQVTMSQAQSVTAQFTLLQYHLMLAESGTGSGTISGTAGVNGSPNCAWDGSAPSGTCDVLYNYNTSVTLTATAGIGSSFVGWTGACTNTSGPCQVTISQAQSVTARFAPSAISRRVGSDRADDVAGSQIHVIYVLPSDGTDRGLDTNGTLSNTVGSFHNWLASQTGGRKLRMDTYQGSLDITFFRLSRTDAVMKSYGAFVRDTIEKELIKAGFTAPAKIYAAYYDGGSTVSCGGGAWPPALPGTVAALYLQGTPPGGAAPCNTNPFAADSTAPPGYIDFAMLHELMHTMGFVSSAAPHFTAAGHVSDSNLDLMYAGPLPWQPAILDFGHDDYFGASLPAGVLNLENDPVLLPSTAPVLAITGAGGGSGSITGTAGVDGTPSCSWMGSTASGACNVIYNTNTQVTLTATPATGSSFAGWSGDCSTASQTCQVTMDKNRSVVATFSSTATASGIACVLLGRCPQFTPAQVAYLDSLGNQNGQLDLGDLVAWLDKFGATLDATTLRKIKARLVP